MYPLQKPTNSFQIQNKDEKKNSPYNFDLQTVVNRGQRLHSTGNSILLGIKKALQFSTILHNVLKFLSNNSRLLHYILTIIYILVSDTTFQYAL